MRSRSRSNAPKLVFSAMDASVATDIERAFAQAGHVVVSNSRNHRMEADVPLLVPEMNHDHLRIVARQQRDRGWKGQIVTNPNCSTIVMTLALGPLKKFGIERIMVTTLQAISGAGYPGVAVDGHQRQRHPVYRRRRREDADRRRRRSSAILSDDDFVRLPAKVSAHCNRVPVVDGHTVLRFRRTRREAGHRGASSRPSRAYTSLPQQKNLPSAPKHPVIYMEQADRPQPRRDVEREKGMAVFVGRLRECPVFDYKFIACGHNTVRGAAGAAVLNAELMYSEGMFD